MERKYHTPAAEGTIKVLEFLAEHPGDWGPTEINRQTGVGINMVFRVLNVLVEHGYLRRNDSGLYTLKSKLLTMGMKLLPRFDLRNTAMPYLQELSRQTSETVQIQIPDGDSMLLLTSLYPPKDYYLTVLPGVRLRYHGNAFGKAVMAFMEKEELNTILDRPLEKITPFTETDKKKILSELKTVRKTLIAEEWEEYILGGYCIGAPVFDESGRAVAGLGISALYSRQEIKELDYYRSCILQCARNVTLACGGTFPE